MKTIVLASSNKSKILEIQRFFKNYKVIPYTNILNKIEIEETGSSFKENAIIKAKAIWNLLVDQKKYIVLADDSGITVPALNNEPGIYSARYARDGASDTENLNYLTSKLKDLKLSRTKALYTVCIAIIDKGTILSTHGFMHGEVVDNPRGYNGFGYDPIFIPKGYEHTLAELDTYVKDSISHRTQALKLSQFLF